MADVVNVRVYATNTGYYSAIDGVYREFFATEQPTRVFVPVASWAGPYNIEIDCVAHLG